MDTRPGWVSISLAIRLGCCPSGSFMSHPFVITFSVEHSCSVCPSDSSSSFTDVKNDELSCNGKCPKLMYYDGINGCQDCPAGKIGSSVGICTECDFGTYSINPASTVCENCLGGKSTVATGSSSTDECINCDGGKRSTGKDDFTTCKDCDKDSYSDIGSSVCLKCEPGQYMPEVDPRPSGSCVDCSAGQFSNYGKVKCTECDRGYYADKTIAATGCKSCPSGQYGSVAAVGQRINEGGACDNCITGKYSKAKGADSDDTCIDCQPGKKAKDIVAATEEAEACTECLVGQYRSSTDTDLTKCRDCTLGTFADAKGLTKCLACDPGKTQGATGQKTCTDCGLGRYMDDTASKTAECKLCGTGTYGGDDEECNPDVPDYNKCGGKEGLSSCVRCWKGRYADQEGMVFFEDCTEW